jgi:hypothetical protein
MPSDIIFLFETGPHCIRCRPYVLVVECPPLVLSSFASHRLDKYTSRPS